MLRKCFNKINFRTRSGQNLIVKEFKKYFSQATYSTRQLDIYPDQIIERFKASSFTEDTWIQLEADVLEKIHFFDTDQFVDLVCLASKADKGTELFWDQLARKIFDYELDLPQTISLTTALRSNSRVPHYIMDPLYRNLISAKVIWENGTEVYKKFI